MTNSPAIGTTGRQSSVHKFGVTLSKDQFQAELGRMNLVRASEIDGEESDGTPKHWRNRPFVSKRQIEALIERMYDVPQTPDSSAVDAGARHAIVQIAALADAAANIGGERHMSATLSDISERLLALSWRTLRGGSESRASS